MARLQLNTWYFWEESFLVLVSRVSPRAATRLIGLSASTPRPAPEPQLLPAPQALTATWLHFHLRHEIMQGGPLFVLLLSLYLSVVSSFFASKELLLVQVFLQLLARLSRRISSLLPLPGSMPILYPIRALLPGSTVCAGFRASRCKESSQVHARVIRLFLWRIPI
ncbi:hypothetical protein GQ43DRAFT_230394 [Delitschia confertaspora ATCC 74209]|uniref:Uncharacterized protein n=1 Tax=Delitschia confertaspora ATCC 74209 TaxID=1513339 RepID=A0A9P4JD38_9PLEO|nr:hypothetical protein GQ43DRAFT_230394 [Delitschia confertaspora ATCC 74209]